MKTTFIPYDMDTDKKLLEIFREHCNLSCEEYEEIRRLFIELVADVQDGRPLAWILMQAEEMSNVFTWLYNVKELTMKEYNDLCNLAGQICRDAVMLAGVLLAILLSWLFLSWQVFSPAQSGLLAMDVGMSLVVLLFLLHIVDYFGLSPEGQNFAFLPYLERHWRLFLISSCYMLGIFLPNLIIWQGPWGVEIAGTFRFAPVYDVVTFLAFISILPLMMLFVVSVETNFYERYDVYFSYITQKGNFREIDDARKDLLHTLWFEIRHIIEFQLVFSLVFLALGNYVLSGAGITYAQVNMYNVIIFGAFFTGLLQLIYILLVYFDYQKDVLRISACYLLSNLLFGLLGFYFAGPDSYGFTFFLASALSFGFGFWRLSHFGERINYFVFCSQPMFYQMVKGPLTRLTLWLYGERYVDLELLGGDKK